MKIAVFDVDGTLTSTNAVDGHCFWASVRASLDVGPEPDWSEFAEVTDTAILADLCASHSTRSCAEIEAEVQRHFFTKLEELAATDPLAFCPIRGAEGVFALTRRAGWTPAIATGGWRQSAEIKLAAAGISTQGVPVASSSDCARRVDIVREAIRQADPAGTASGAVLVGDALWDLRVCRTLRIGFVGRAEGASARRLAEHGVEALVPHFGAPDPFLAALETALRLPETAA
jgi:phosphoglycolate phosphatase-like HAD superfamily hydrolase